MDFIGLPRPANVGIVAMDMYSPSRFVAQEDLEKSDNCLGKYTIGLGQLNMAFTDDREDITSMFLTVTKNLLQRFNIDPKMVGRLEVGTETLTDKSKSIKTSLISLFDENTNVEGVTNVNACYGGTAALFNSLAWVESSEWDGRYALVVCGDIAVYDVGPARPTGGCGVVAMLIGPDAPLVLEPGVRATHTLDVYDFYKPLHSEYALVDGRLSQRAYLSSVDICYKRYKEKYSKRFPTTSATPPVTVDHFDYFAFHSPYNKLVQKGFGRLYWIDSKDADNDSVLKPFHSLADDVTYEHKDVDAALKNISSEAFQKKVLPCCDISRNVGNCYTASVFTCLFSIVANQGSELVDKRIGMFSFGSGSIASFYSFVGRDTSSAAHGFTLQKLQASGSDFMGKLASRTRASVAEFSQALDLRAQAYGVAPAIPTGEISTLKPGTYYLYSIDELHRREYRLVV